MNFRQMGSTTAPLDCTCTGDEVDAWLAGLEEGKFNRPPSLHKLNDEKEALLTSHRAWLTSSNCIASEWKSGGLQGSKWKKSRAEEER